MSITCTVCGTVNPDGTKFCDGCGVELPTQSAAPAAAPVTASESSSAPASALSEAPANAAPITATPGELAPAAPVETPAPETPVLETPPLEPVTPESSTVSGVGISEVGTSNPVDVNSPVDAPVTPGLPDMPLMDTPVSEAAPVAAPVATPETSSTTENSTAMNSAAANNAAEAKLGIKKYGSATGEFIPLKGEKLVVGRFDASTGPVDIDLSGLGGQEHISRRHAELYREGGVWKVRDLGSTNGVYIKRKGEASFSPRLQEPAELHDGDELAFGNLMLDFVQS